MGKLVGFCQLAFMSLFDNADPFNDTFDPFNDDVLSIMTQRDTTESLSPC